MTLEAVAAAVVPVLVDADVHQAVGHPFEVARPSSVPLLLDVEEAGEVTAEPQGHVQPTIVDAVVADRDLLAHAPADVS